MDDDNSQISTSFSSIRTLHPLSADTSIHISTTSLPSSPRSSALPSPPDSPSSDSVSSFPSVSSSFFFSSAAASPPHFAGPSEHGRESTQSLIIPSLTLPSALQRPTSYGQTLGELKLIFLSLKRQEEDFPTQLLSEDNEDVVDVDPWEQSDCGRVLHASTDWVEHRDLHGLERFEPLRNIEVIELPPYDQDDDVSRFPVRGSHSPYCTGPSIGCEDRVPHSCCISICLRYSFQRASSFISCRQSYIVTFITPIHSAPTICSLM